jgi:hypothetical protein
VIAAAAIAAILAIGCSIAVGLFNQAGYYQDAANEARQYARFADQKIGQACRGAPADQLVNCFAEARIQGDLDKHQSEHDQADLVAQRKSALWTEIMGIAALIGMGLSVVGVVLVWITFRETRRQANLAEQALTATQGVSAAELRAWVSISIRLTKVVADYHGIAVDYEVVFKNIGQTAARHFTNHRTSQFMSEGRYTKAIDSFFSKWKPPQDKKNRTALMPGEEDAFSSSHMSARTKIEWFGDKEPKRTYFVIVASAFYWSAMDKEWHRTDRSFTVGVRKHDFYDDRFLYDDMGGEWKGETLSELVIKSGRPGETT